MVSKQHLRIPLRLAGILGILLFAASARAAILSSRGNTSITNANWPVGSETLANLTTRVGWWEGPPFGGGRHEFLYRGDTAAFQDALDLFAKIRAPELLLIVHEGRGDSPFLANNDARDRAPINPADDPERAYDWSFAVWNAEVWHHLYNNPASAFASRTPDGSFREPVAPPQMEVFVAGPDGQGIDFKQIKIPAGVTVRDERATTHGYKAEDGSVIVGDVYDMSTSVTIAGATLVLLKYKDTNQWEEVATASADDAGHFELKQIPAGSYQMQVRSEAYKPRYLGGVTVGGNTYKKVVTYLAKPAAVIGTVVDMAGKAIGGATVRVDSMRGIDGRGYLTAVTGDGSQVTTDQEGRFEISGVPKGYYQLWATAKGYAMTEVFKDYDAPGENVTLHLIRTGTVKGKVMKDSATANPDANVSLIPVGGEKVGSWSGSMHVKDDGSYEFAEVPPGNYLISTDGRPAIMGADPTAKPVEVKSGQTVEMELTKK